MVRVNRTPLNTIPQQWAFDPEVGPFVRELLELIRQLRDRTGGDTDIVDLPPPLYGDDQVDTVAELPSISSSDDPDLDGIRRELNDLKTLILQAQSESNSSRLDELEQMVSALFFCEDNSRSIADITRIDSDTVDITYNTGEVERHDFSPACSGGGAATVEIGPNYGDATKSETFTTGATVSIGDQSLEFGAVTAGGTVTAPAHTIAHDAVTAGGTVTAPAHTTAFSPQTAGATISELSFSTTTIIADKDVVVNDTVGCVGAGGNRDGQDLEINGGTTTPRISFIAWDLSGFPAGATVTAATLYVECKTAGTSGTNYTLHKISNANETWAESTLVCSGAPASAGNMQTWSAAFNSTGAKTLALNGTVLARIEERMGVGFFTLRIEGGALQVVSAVLESKDEGTNDALGPRIDLAFTVV